MAKTVLLCAVVACSKPTSEPSPDPRPVAAKPSDAAIAKPVAIDAAAAAAAPAATACLVNGENVRGYDFGEIGSDLVTCGGPDPVTCFTIDRKSGALTPRKEVALPGVPHSVKADTLSARNC